VAWSSGKDSAWALHLLRARAEVEVVGLLTTVNEAFGRVAMHAVRVELVEAQARALGLPLIQVPIPNPSTNAQYEAAMARALGRARADGVSAIAFGDLFLEDVRRYRETRLEGTGIRPLFPLWGRDTAVLSGEMVASGLRAVVTAVDPRLLDASFAGRTYDADYLRDLPAAVDPCGENGEFHTFTFEGPMFGAPIRVSAGDVVARDGFVFADVIPAQRPSSRATRGLRPPGRGERGRSLPGRAR
jgi:uncharacterized protein (TIGR00290 family)